MSSLLDGMAYPAVDAAVALTAIYLVVRDKRTISPQLASPFSHIASALLVVLAASDYSGLARTLNQVASFALPLLAVHPSGHTIFQLANALRIYRLFHNNDSPLISAICILLHICLVLANLDLSSQAQLKSIMHDASFAQVRQLNILQKLRELTIDDLWPVPKRFQLRHAYAELAINTDESLFLVRAIARMIWKPMIPIHIAGMLFQLLPIFKTILNGYIYHCLDSSDSTVYYKAYMAAAGDSIDEIYFNVKTVKLFGWERMYLDPKLRRTREYLKQLPWYAALVRFGLATMDIVSTLTTDLSMYLTVVLYLNTMPTSDNSMTNSKLLEMTEHIEYLRQSIYNIAEGIAGISDLVRHNNTLEPLFRCETFNTISHVKLVETETVPSITMDNCSFRWEKKANLLKQVTLNATGGELVAVVGKTGSGKSSLLLAMCRELEKTKGTGTVVGRIGYMEQSPWIMNDTMRANILFGRDFDEEYYWKVIHACALTRDLDSWPDSDLTMIGERGINISGGQRARLALARTVYSQAEIYILDDPLSAVDAHVKRHILDNVILSSGLLGNKLRVITTHSESMLPFCNQIATVSDKTVSVFHQEPKEHLYIAPAVEINDVCASTPTEANSDKLSTTPTNDVDAQATTSENVPSKCLESDEDQLPQQKRTLLDNAKIASKFDNTVANSLRNISDEVDSGHSQTSSIIDDGSLMIRMFGVELMRMPNRLKRFSNDITTFRQFSDIKPEAPYAVDNCRVPSEWPHNGNVEFKDLSVKYGAHQPYVLKNLNINIRPGEKVGIVGRTGAGKSTLAKAIFRLLNKNIEGSIEIDGHDTSKFGVGDFRPKLGIIPQESTMFRGTVKRNLDPLNEFTIEDMWAAMIKCGVADLIEPERKRKTAKLASKSANANGDDRNDDEDDVMEEEDDKSYWDRENKQRWARSGLLMRAVLFMFDRKWEKYEVKESISIGINGMVSSNGGGFSNGQQQLFSLCRLLMRKRKVMILDEATADVDLETDRKIQELIRTEFSECTVLTIAHRLDTIMNSDRIIVMEKGEIVEIGPPQELISNGGKFAELVQANAF
ncbi:Canalicular multispecific organic anion transporter 1 [Coemansia aciculifera]|nr:Canalicular multispecific organic anion transporter 1 [Coemansia aciculifera]